MVVTFLAIGWVSEPVRQSKYSGLSLQFARNINQAQIILGEWKEPLQRVVASSIRIDFVFIVFYVATLVVGCQIAADAFADGGQMQLAKWGGLLAWAAIAAGTFDAIENWGQLQLLRGHLNPGWPPVITVCASIKFFLASVDLIYVITALALFRSRFFA